MSSGIGILTVALGSETYRQLAINLALSLRKWSSLPVAVVVSPGPANELDIHRFFDHVIICDDPTVPLGCAAKLHVDKWTPFEETLFIDADCLVYGRGLDDLLRSYRSYFMMMAEFKTAGRWGSARIEKLAALLGTERFLKTNSGAFFWKSGRESDSIFRCARKIFENHRKQLSWKIGLNDASYNDEPILCAALTIAGWSPESQNEGTRSLMVSTIGASEFRSDAELGTVVFIKQGRQQTPLICHFCGLKPKVAYQHDVNFLRADVGVDSYFVPEASLGKRARMQFVRYTRFSKICILAIEPR